MPYRIAFSNYDKNWAIVEYLADGVFIIDIFLNFFCAYYDYEDKLVTSNKVLN